MTEYEELEKRIIDLELRLMRYQSDLFDAMVIDREHTHNQLWGFQTTILGWGGFFLVVLLADRFLPDNWIVGLLSAVVGLGVLGALSVGMDKEREKSQKKFSRQPRWRESRWD